MLRTGRGISKRRWCGCTPKPLRPGSTYLLKHTSQTVRARVVEIRSRIHVEHLEHHAAEQLGLNDIGQVVIETSRPLLADLYRDSRATGSLILIDPADNTTAGAGMIRSIADAAESESRLNRATRGLLVLGDRRKLASQLEQGSAASRRHCAAHARCRCRRRSLRIARLGALVLVESDDAGPITLTPVHGSDTTPHELAFDEPDEILNEIQRLGAIPNGEDENDDGLGI